MGLVIPSKLTLSTYRCTFQSYYQTVDSASNENIDRKGSRHMRCVVHLLYLISIHCESSRMYISDISSRVFISVRSTCKGIAYSACRSERFQYYSSLLFTFFCFLISFTWTYMYAAHIGYICALNVCTCALLYS